MSLFMKQLEDNKHLLYFPTKYRLFVSDKNLSDIAIMINDGATYEEILEKSDGITRKRYDELKQLIFADEEIEAELNDKRLSRLVLNISNDCNMNCLYCYANGGNYHSESGLMSHKTLIRTLDIMYQFYPEIELIQLFGGEPMLNTDLIKETCIYLKTHKKTSKIGMVTNGTIITDELIKLVHEYEFCVTVSIDAKKIHDELRMFKNGMGTFDVIKQNIEKLRNVSTEPSLLEVTYTKIHKEKGIKINDIIDELNNYFPDIPIHLVGVSTQDESYKIKDSEVYIESIKEEFSRVKTLDEIKGTPTQRYLRPLRKKRGSQNVCHAGYDSISVSSTGDIYPCSAFIDVTDFYIANIFEDDKILFNKLKMIRDQYFKIKKNDILKCRNCFANTLCSGCLHENYIDTGEIYNPSDEFCNVVRDSVEQVLTNLIVMQGK